MKGSSELTIANPCGCYLHIASDFVQHCQEVWRKMRTRACQVGMRLPTVIGPIREKLLELTSLVAILC